MEKYTKWEDRSSGVNLFVPPVPRLPRNIIVRCLRHLFGGVLALFRALLILCTLAFGGLIVLVCQAVTALALGALLWWAVQGLMPPPVVLGGAAYALIAAVVPALGRALPGLVVRTLVGTVLGIMGVNVEERHGDLRRLGLRPPGTPAPTGRVGGDVEGGDIIVANHTSFVEVLYLWSRFLPAFTRVTLADGDYKRPHVSFIGALRALWLATHKPQLEAPQGKPSTLEEVSKFAARQRAPVVVFPEVVRSNGVGVLEFARVLDSLGGAAKVHLVAFSYRDTGCRLPHPVGPLYLHMYDVLSQFSRSHVVVSVVSKAHAPPPPSDTAGPALAAYTEGLRSLVASMVGKPKVALTFRDQASFEEYWDLLRHGKKKQAATLADKRKKA